MANNLKPQNPGNVFQHQFHPSNLRRPRGGVMQDKGAGKSGRAASVQPAPLKKVSGARASDMKLFRSNKRDNTKVKLVHRTIHLHPIDDEELKHIATTDGLSVSSVGATAVHEWILWKIHKREESLMYPKLRQIIREEQQAFGNRIVFFLMRIAFAAEQARILITNVLHRILKRDGVTDEIFHSLVDQSNKMARRNIVTKTPQIKTLIKEWKAQEPQE